MLTEPETFTKRTVCCIVSGGNVDPQIYARILLEE
jgi:threonine dehydratase